MDYAGFWVRVGAYLIDMVILWIAQFAIYAVFGVSMYGATSLDPEASDAFATGAGIVAYLLTIIVAILYFAVMESSSKQATFGKMALGLVVTDQNGGQITFLRAVGRYFAKILSALVLFIGYIMVAFTERKQGLHDILASTLVVKGQPGLVGVDPGVFE